MFPGAGQFKTDSDTRRGESTATINLTVHDVQAHASNNPSKRKLGRSARRRSAGLTEPSTEPDQADRLPFVSIKNLAYCATHLSRREA